MKPLKLFFLLLLPLLVQSHALAAESLTVAVAANVKYAFDDLALEFKKLSGIEAKSVVASSGKIAAQVKSGAPFDVFLSADTEFPELLYKEGYAATPPKIYAYGTLVLWTQTNIDLSKNIEVLRDTAVHRIAIANPKLAPYGREALKVLDYYKLRAVIEPKLIYGESIAQVNQYVDTQSADIGFTAKSIVTAPETSGRGKWVEVPRESYEPIAQSMVILKHGSTANNEAAHKFCEFLLSPPARAIFNKYGYTSP